MPLRGLQPYFLCRHIFSKCCLFDSVQQYKRVFVTTDSCKQIFLTFANVNMKKN